MPPLSARPALPGLGLAARISLVTSCSSVSGETLAYSRRRGPRRRTQRNCGTPHAPARRARRVAPEPNGSPATASGSAFSGRLRTRGSRFGDAALEAARSPFRTRLTALVRPGIFRASLVSMQRRGSRQDRVYSISCLTAFATSRSPHATTRLEIAVLARRRRVASLSLMRMTSESSRTVLSRERSITEGREPGCMLHERSPRTLSDERGFHG
jgi:hypothetical protein